MDTPTIDPAGCRWVWRDEAWLLMQGPDKRLGAVRREPRWVPYDADWQPLHDESYHHAPEARARVEQALGIGHVMVSEHTTGG